MKKILIITTILLLFFSITNCKKTKSKYTIGISKIVTHPALDAVENGIMDELKEMGKNDIEFNLQNANGDANAAKQIALMFKTKKVDIAVGIATPTSQALVSSLDKIPVVFSAVTDPVGAGLVDDVNTGSKNVTGVSDMTPIEEQIKMLMNILPIKKLGIIYSSNEANSKTIADITKKVCSKYNMEYIEMTVVNSGEVKQAAESIIRKVDAIYISTDNTVVSAINPVVEVAANKNIPILSADPSSAKNTGVLVAYGFDYYKMGRVTGRLIGEIIDGKKTADLPTQYLTDKKDLDLLLNLDVAEQLNITIPEEILEKATIIIENGNITQK